MNTQQYSNHVRYYTPHHFIFYPVVGLMLFIGVRGMMTDPVNRAFWLLVSALTLITGWLSFMMRQHYALVCQDRIVRLELRLRYYQLTRQRLEDIEAQLSFKQLAALRFASDDELVALVQRTLREGLSPKDIKKSVKNWLPDTMRV